MKALICMSVTPSSETIGSEIAIEGQIQGQEALLRSLLLKVYEEARAKKFAWKGVKQTS